MAPLQPLVIILFTYALLASASHSFKANTVFKHRNQRLVGRVESHNHTAPLSLPIPGVPSSNSSSSANVSATASPPSTPTSVAGNAGSALADMQRVTSRRLSNIVGSLPETSTSDIDAWLKSLDSNGQWPSSEVNYATGCSADRANWPAEVHWERLLAMAGAWHGGLQGTEQYVQDSTVHDAIGKGMDFWFSRDFTNTACFDQGGTNACPCNDADTTFWNTNWFGNVILIPNLVSQTCLIMNNTLSTSQLAGCIRMTGRTYNSFNTGIKSASSITGANALDIAKIGIDLALFTSNDTMIAEAYSRIHKELVVQQAVKADGIRPDGAFGQHTGLLYNGNYGKDFTNDVLDLEIEAGGTQFAAGSSGQSAFKTLFDGDKWMIVYNTLTSTLHWDLSALGRFISFPVADQMATGSLNINLTKIEVLGREWSAPELGSFSSSLKASSGVNAGNLKGNRMFFTNDYMVHRGSNYVSTLKMYSTRTLNSECTNSQNPLGFHLADGVLYTYLNGNEYEDISAAWDWNLIPGITTDYGATPLNCNQVRFKGLQNFVGGVSDGRTGIAAMSYTNPLSKTFSFQKAWFFLDDDVQHVMISNVSSGSSVPVISVLDQKRRSGSIYIGGTDGADNITAGTPLQVTHNVPGVEGLWHDNVGYVMTAPGTSLSVQAGVKTGSWSEIGTSAQPDANVDLFAAWITHDSTSLDAPIAYSTYPSISMDEFRAKAFKPSYIPIQNDAHVSAVLDTKRNTFMAIFWDQAGGSVQCQSPGAPFTISANTGAAIIYDIGQRTLTISDPSQTAQSVGITVTLGPGGKGQNVNVTLPQGGMAGSSVSQKLGGI